METLYKNIKARRLELRLTQSELAERMGYSDKSMISRIEAGKVDLTHSKIIDFAKALQINAGNLMGWEKENTSNTIPVGFEPLPQTDHLPRVGAIACGTPILAEENIETYDKAPHMWHADFTLVCKGDSMIPSIQDGDIVAIKKTVDVENGEIAAIRINDEATLKHLYRYADRIVLQPENPAFPPLIYVGEEANQIIIEGKAVGLCRNL